MFYFIPEGKYLISQECKVKTTGYEVLGDFILTNDFGSYRVTSLLWKHFYIYTRRRKKTNLYLCTQKSPLICVLYISTIYFLNTFSLLYTKSLFLLFYFYILLLSVHVLNSYNTAVLWMKCNAMHLIFPNLTYTL